MVLSYSHNRRADFNVLSPSSHSSMSISLTRVILVFAMERGPGVAHQILKHGHAGKPDKITEKLKDYKNPGVDQFFLAFQHPFDHNQGNKIEDI